MRVLVTITDATLAVTQALHEGKLVVLDRAGGVAVTLPAATGSGARYRFFVKTTFTTAGTIPGSPFTSSSYSTITDAVFFTSTVVGLGLYLAIAAVSLVDDIRKFSFAVKLASQILATAVILASGLVLETLSFPYFGTLTLGWFGYPLTALWIIGLTNAFNFMDGLNGLAGGTAIIVALFFGIVTFLDGNAFVAALCFIILFSTLGFLIFNFPQARVFMSDVGSQFLGFVFAVLAVIASQYESAHTSFLVMPLLFFHFIYDTTLTFLRRLIHREKIAAAHRSHLYQLANRLGLSHVQVSLYHYLIAILQGLGALWLIHLPPDRRALAFVPFLLFQCGYAFVILVRADRRGLLHLRL